jgi:hypothetical protein
MLECFLPFCSSLIFEVWPSRPIIDWFGSNLSDANTLAYFDSLSATNERKCFITLTPGQHLFSCLHRLVEHPVRHPGALPHDEHL